MMSNHLDIRLTLIKESDIPFVHEVRNSAETAKFLHDDTLYTYDECLRWFNTFEPNWFIIWKGEERVGYFRTSDDDDGIMIGADIHPDHRGKGIAKAAYVDFIEHLRQLDHKLIKLEVLSHNIRAINLYRKLGFEEVGRRVEIAKRDGNIVDSIIMELTSQT